MPPPARCERTKELFTLRGKGLRLWSARSRYNASYNQQIFATVLCTAKISFITLVHYVK